MYSNLFKISLWQYKATKNCCWWHCGGPWVIWNVEGNAIKRAMCALNVYFITGTIYDCRKGSDVGIKLCVWLAACCLRDPFEEGWQGPEWRTFRLVLEKKRILSCCRYRVERRERQPPQESVDVAYWCMYDMFSWSYHGSWPLWKSSKKRGWSPPAETTTCLVSFQLHIKLTVVAVMWCLSTWSVSCLICGSRWSLDRSSQIFLEVLLWNNCFLFLMVWFWCWRPRQASGVHFVVFRGGLTGKNELLPGFNIMKTILNKCRT